MEMISLDSLPVGLRFRPTDEELIRFYLRSKINGNDEDVRVICEVDICKWEPWDLPDLSIIKTEDMEWLFFCPLDRKYPNGRRMNRATVAGYWKATGKDRSIKSRNNVIGVKRTLVFYTGRAPKGTRTGWVMHEYRATEKDLDGTTPGQNPFVICKLFRKQDQNPEDSKSNEVGPAVSSPTVAKSSVGDLKSEFEPSEVSPTIKTQIGKHLGNKTDITSANSDTGAVSHCQSNHTDAYDAEDQAAEATNVEVDLQLQDLDLFHDPTLESLEFRIFSPLHSQLQSEFGFPLDIVQSNTGNLYNNHGGVQIQHGTNDSDAYISEFLDSILANPDEHFTDAELRNKKDCLFQSEFIGLLDAECAQVQGATKAQLQNGTTHEGYWMKQGSVSHYSDAVGYYQESSNLIPSTRRDDLTGTGITIRSRRPQTQHRILNSMVQGDASRRILLQCNLNGQKLEFEHHEVQPNDEQVEGTRKGRSEEDLKACPGGGTQTKLRPRSMGFIYKKVASIATCSYTAVLRAAVVALVFLTSVCSLRAW